MRTVLLATVTGMMFAASAIAGTVALHEDDNDPLTEGWSDFRGPINTMAVTGDVGGFDAWQTDDPGGGFEGGYEFGLTTQQETDALNNGWKFSARLRVLDPEQDVNEAIFAGVNLRVAGPPDERFHLVFGSSAGIPEVEFVGGSRVSMPDLSNDDYHLYEVIYDPGTATADLFVDGIERISDFVGVDSGFQDHRVTFGSGGGGAAGVANWNLVKFEIIPEPMSLCLLSIGGMMGGMMIRRRRYS